MFEIDECIDRPELLPDFLPGHNLPCPSQQQFQNQVRLTAKFHLRPALGKLAHTRDYFERAEAVFVSEPHKSPPTGATTLRRILPLLAGSGAAKKQLEPIKFLDQVQNNHRYFKGLTTHLRLTDISPSMHCASCIYGRHSPRVSTQSGKDGVGFRTVGFRTKEGFLSVALDRLSPPRHRSALCLSLCC